MKFNINNQIPSIKLSLLSIIVICFALEKCVVQSTIDASPPKPTDSEAPSSLSPSEAPSSLSPTSEAPSSEAPAADAQSPASLSPSEAPAADDALTPASLSPEAPADDALTPESSISFSPSEAPYGDAGAPEAESPGSADGSGYPSAFSGAFSDILKGDPSAMSPQGSLNTKPVKNSPVEQICAHTQYPDVCLKTIQPLLSNHNIKVDVTKVLEVAIKACASQVKLTITKVEKHAAKSPELAEQLADCKEKYNTALKSLKSAVECIPNKDIGKLTVTLSSVMADVSTCESKFEDLKSSSASSKTDGLVSIMVNNCLSIAKMIEH